MITKTTILLSLALCVLGDGPHAISEQHIKIHHKEHHGHHGELSHIGSEKPEHHEEYAWSYPSYEFSYSVDDPHTHDKKGQKESRNGDEVKGEYWLIQPDGHKRTVTYHADKHSGFHADVKYSDYEHGKDDGVEEKGGDEDENVDKKHRNDDDDGGKDEGGNADGDNEEGNDEGGDEGRGGEESRGLEGGVVRWGFGPKWNQEKEDRHHGDVRRDRDEGRRDEGRGRGEGRRDEGRGRNEGRRDERRGRDEGRREEGRGRDEGRRNKDNRRDDHLKNDDFSKLSIFGGMGSYGRRDDRRGDDGREREESHLWEERRKFDERRGYPSHITPYYGHPSRVHPRFYRQNKEQPRTVGRQ